MADEYIKDVIDEICLVPQFVKGSFGTYADNYPIGKGYLLYDPCDKS